MNTEWGMMDQRLPCPGKGVRHSAFIVAHSFFRIRPPGSNDPKSQLRRGFTLIELMVAIGLMVILVTTIALIFGRATELYRVSEARTRVYQNARVACDLLEMDLVNALPIESEQQRFWLREAEVPSPPAQATAEEGIDKEADFIQFVAITSAPSARGLPDPELRTVVISYYLRRENDSELVLEGSGVSTAQRTGRRLFVLRRLTRNFTGNNPVPSDTVVFGAGFATLPGDNLDDSSVANQVLSCPASSPWGNCGEIGDLCHYVVSFNVEVQHQPLGQPIRYWQLEESGHPFGPTAPYPLGDKSPADESRPPTKIRVSLRIVEGAAELQERVIIRDIWLPMS